METKRLLELAGMQLNEQGPITITVKLDPSVVQQAAEDMGHEYKDALKLVVEGIQQIGNDAQYIQDLLNI